MIRRLEIGKDAECYFCRKSTRIVYYGVENYAHICDRCILEMTPILPADLVEWRNSGPKNQPSGREYIIQFVCSELFKLISKSLAHSLSGMMDKEKKAQDHE